MNNKALESLRVLEEILPHESKILEFDMRGEDRIPCFISLEWIERAHDAITEIQAALQSDSVDVMMEQLAGPRTDIFTFEWGPYEGNRWAFRFNGKTYTGPTPSAAIKEAIGKMG